MESETCRRQLNYCTKDRELICLKMVRRTILLEKEGKKVFRILQNGQNVNLVTVQAQQ